MQMRSHFFNRHGAGAVAAAALALAVAVAPEARADDCSALAGDQNTIVYVTGSSAVKPFLAKVAAQLLGESPPIYVVYLSQGSCVGVTTMTQTPAGTISGTGATIWDNTGTAIAGGCDLALGGTTTDIGASDVYAATCGGAPVTSDVKDVHGPNQIMTFAVPKASTANSISAEAAYLVYGFGAATHPVAPWTDPNLIFQRSSGSGTQNMLGTAIGVPAASWKPTANTNSSSDLLFGALTLAASNGNASKAIGILATDYVDLHRDTVKALAYQHTGQSCGYTPDSTGAAFDKANVRDGHYMVWGPLHLYVHTDSGGATLKASTQKVIDLLSLATTVDDGAAQTLITTEAKGGVVPDCAMHVSRTTEVGPLASYQPAKGCECKFLKESTAPLPSDCKSCTGDGDCVVASGARGTHCNYGYCEVK